MTSIIPINIILDYIGIGIQFILTKVFHLTIANKISGIAIPYYEPKLIDSLVSPDTALLNLDGEINETLSDSEKLQQPTGSLLSVKLFIRDVRQ